MAADTILLQDIVNTDDVLDLAFATPAMRINPKGRKRPTLDQAMKACLSGVQQAVVNYVVEQFQPELEKAYKAFVKKNGTHEAAKNKEAWESKQDAMVEELIEPYVPYLSQTWLAVNTIGSSLHTPNGVAEFAAELGKGYYKALTHGKVPGDILASVGLTTSMIERRYETHINPSEQEKETMADQQEQDLDAVLRKIAEHVGKDHDAMQVYDDLDFASDDDEGLAAGAAARLGLDEEDLVVLQSERLVHGSDVMDILHQQIQAILDGAAKKPKKAAKAKKEPKAAKQPGEYEPVPEPKRERGESRLSPEVLKALKLAGLPDTEAANNVGVSRQTYTQYLSGKIDFKPNETQITYLRGELVDRLNVLHEALAVVDGDEEPHSVF